MAADGGQRDVERLGDLADAHLPPVREPGEDGASGGIGEGGEGPIENGGFFI
jgi:hypothetical protein